GLLFTARALQLRIKKARKWALVFIALTLLFSIILGESPVVFAYLILLFAALFAAKEYFYRQRSMLNIPFYTWWFCAAGGIFVAAVWAGFFVNKQDITAWFVNPKIFIDALLADGQASRFLRTAIGISVLFVIVVIEEIFRKTFNKLSLFSKDDIYNIVSCSNNSYALNALTGSKNFIVNEDKDAFISYAVAGNNWIALNDPAGNPNKKRELLWQFKEAADRKNALISFVDIRRKYIETYRDIGLDILNIGQEAKIVLKNFSEDNPYFTDLVSSFENEGFVYEIVKSADFEKYKDIFAQINKQWEKDSNYISRNFVPGDYNEEKIIKGMDFSVLKKDGIICGFCILSAVKNKYEASCQIVRYANCSKDAFEYMVYKNVLWAKENEYKFFDLGLTYNNEEGNRIIKYFAQIYAFSEHFNYDFTALREFKNRFNPLWNDKYAAIRFDEHLLMFIRNFTILIYPPKEKKHIRLFFKRFFVR
ncbi:MAG: phosphatidylglycerol lysyltransferase domain-containing protein, partial [Elusimicrobiota bacterium]|nr:phosphatidylglycerol lysyltransferase domain-containing protein [Elusimicrobiota bacterium]